MSLFVFLNLSFCVITFLAFAAIFLRYRYLFVKPSILVLAFFHLSIQWAAAFQASAIELFLPRPYPFFVLAQVFPLLGLVGSFFILHRRAAIVSQRCAGSVMDLDVHPYQIVLLFFAVLGIAGLYLMTVPLSQTGLAAIFIRPEESHQARELSLKLLDNALVRYAFSFLKTVFTPLLVVLATVWLLQNLRRLRVAAALFCTICLGVSFVAVVLPGARLPGALLFFTIIWALLLRYKIKIKPLYFFPAVLLVVGLPVVLTVMREGQDLNLLAFLDYLKGGIFERIFVIPMEVGLWHVHYAQTSGFVGIAAIPKLAVLFGETPLYVPNLIFQKYTLYELESGSAVTSFVFSYYSYFGMVSFVFSLLALWSLDLTLLVFRRFRNNAMLLAALAALHTSSIAFVSTDFTTVLITNGFLLILVVGVLLDRYAPATFTKEKM